MLSGLDPSTQQYLNQLNRIGDRMGSAQQRVTTGLKIAQVSDAPEAISLLLGAQASLSANVQTLSDLSRVKTEVDGGEQALENAVGLFDQVQTLGAQGATDLQTAAGRADIAQQLDNLLQQFVGLAGTSVEGRFIFSGDTDQQVPYTYTAALPAPLSLYLGSATTRITQHPNGTTFPLALTARQIFDSAAPATNVFTTLQNLSAALKANDSVAIQTAVDGLPAVGEYLNSQLAFYGATQNKIAAATDFGNTLQIQLEARLSNLRDADTTQSILEMTQEQTQQQAALQSRAKLPRSTLFDYLG